MKLGIIGAGGHGKVVGDIALSLNYNQIFYFDDINKSKEIKFLGNYKLLPRYIIPIPVAAPTTPKKGVATTTPVNARIEGEEYAIAVGIEVIPKAEV